MYIFMYIFPIFYVYFILVQKMIVAYPKSYPSPMMFPFPLSLSCALTRSPLNPSGRLSSTPSCSFPSAVSRKKENPKNLPSGR